MEWIRISQNKLKIMLTAEDARHYELNCEEADYTDMVKYNIFQKEVCAMRYFADTCAVELSVDELCALAHKSGHLDARRPHRMPQAVDPRKFKLPTETEREENVFLRQTVKHLPAMRKILGGEDPVEKGMATLPDILAWRIPWTEEPGELQSIGSQRVVHD